ncbi:hypothetical protein SAMN05444147_101478 [Pectobacterium carotovorum]|nr:hypothetical protein SAMN05444147_101478 [Pectobacterium carotovorum]
MFKDPDLNPGFSLYRPALQFWFKHQFTAFNGDDNGLSSINTEF